MCAGCNQFGLCESCTNINTAISFLHQEECFCWSTLCHESSYPNFDDLRLLIRLLYIRANREKLNQLHTLTRNKALGYVFEDDFDEVEELMSGIDGGDDGNIEEDSLNRLIELVL